MMAIGVVGGGMSCIIVYCMGASEGEYLPGVSVMLCSSGCIFLEKGGSGKHNVGEDGGACGVDIVCSMCGAKYNDHDVLCDFLTHIMNGRWCWTHDLNRWKCRSFG